LTARVVIAPAADKDTNVILADLASNAGRRTAARLNSLFDQLYVRLATHPEIGAPRPQLGPGVRIGIVSPYIIIYRYASDTDTITVLRIVHGRRRIIRSMLPEV
jgi:toxin ParE1/3/4